MKAEKTNMIKNKAGNQTGVFIILIKPLPGKLMI
jgi:hypothetical protein